MKIATWNVNSARARIDRIVDVLTRHDLDVLALQEIKCKDEQFPMEAITDLGYEVAVHGLNQWNGVAIISRVGLNNIRKSFPNQPGFLKGEPDGDELFIPMPEPEARAIGAMVGDIELWSLYVPNGRGVTDPHYYYKLDFLAKLNDYANSRYQAEPNLKMALVGDWNVVPTDADIWDTQATEAGLYLTEPERAAFFAFTESGFQEVTRELATDYTYWDYQQLRFPRDEGLRIDYVYTSPALASTAISCKIDKAERQGKGASDHVPVIVNFS